MSTGCGDLSLARAAPARGAKSACRATRLEFAISRESGKLRESLEFTWQHGEPLGSPRLSRAVRFLQTDWGDARRMRALDSVASRDYSWRLPLAPGRSPRKR